MFLTIGYQNKKEEKKEKQNVAVLAENESAPAEMPISIDVGMLTPVELETLTVEPKMQNFGETDEITRLKMLLDWAKDGDVITLKAGKYDLPASVVVNRDVVIRGEEGKDVVLTSSDSAVFHITSGSPKFENLTVANNEELSSAFLITGGSPKISDCVIIADNGMGIRVQGKESSPEVSQCMIKNSQFAVWFGLKKKLADILTIVKFLTLSIKNVDRWLPSCQNRIRNSRTVVFIIIIR